MRHMAVADPVKRQSTPNDEANSGYIFDLLQFFMTASVV
jgi:hypothetical protein